MAAGWHQVEMHQVTRDSAGSDAAASAPERLLHILQPVLAVNRPPVPLVASSPQLGSSVPKCSSSLDEERVTVEAAASASSAHAAEGPFLQSHGQQWQHDQFPGNERHIWSVLVAGVH